MPADPLVTLQAPPPFPNPETGAPYPASIDWHGLPVLVENTRYSARRGVNDRGERWESEMPDHYGEVFGTVASDGDALDVFVGRDPEATHVYVVATAHPDGSFDEVKAMLNYPSRDAAMTTIRTAYDDSLKVLRVTDWTIPDFIARCRKGDVKGDWRHGRGSRRGFHADDLRAKACQALGIPEDTDPVEVRRLAGEHLARLRVGMTKAAPGVALAPSKTNPAVKRWQRISSAQGTTFTAPLRSGNVTWKVGASNEPGHVKLLSSLHNYESGPHIPTESVEHFHDDLNGVLRAAPTSGNPHVDAVLSGHGEHVGKGNDGIVYTHGDHAVKVSTTVPFHPDNSFHRTPAGAAAHLAAETAAHERFADLPAIPKATGVDHEGRHYLVKPKMTFGEKYTAEELKPVFDTVRSIHARGFVVGDDVQVGRASDGKVYLSDLGQVRPIKHSSHLDNDEHDDLRKLGDLYREHGHTMPLDAGQAEMAYRSSLRGSVAMFRASVQARRTQESRDRLIAAVERSGVIDKLTALEDIHRATGNREALDALAAEHSALEDDMYGGGPDDRGADLTKTSISLQRFQEMILARRASHADLESAGQVGLFGASHADLVPKRVTVEGHTTTHGVFVPQHTTTVHVRREEAPAATPEPPAVDPAPTMPHEREATRSDRDVSTWDVPPHKLAALQAKIEGLRKKAARLGIAPPTLEILGAATSKAFTITEANPFEDGGTRTREVMREVIPVRITGPVIKAPGWDVVGMFEPTPAGNLLTSFSSSAELPAHLHGAEATCEHCNLARDRKRIFVMSERDTGKLKKIGGSCVEEFTGLNPHAAAGAAAYMQDFYGGSEGEFDEFGATREALPDTLDVLVAAAYSHLKFGFIRSWDAGSTADHVRGIFGRHKDIDRPRGEHYTRAKAHAERVLAWMKAIPSNADSSYLRNLRTLADLPQIPNDRSIGLLASAPQAYEQAMGEARRRETETFFGKPGDKIGPLTAKDKKAGATSHEPVHVRLASKRVVDTGYGPQTILRFEDQDGHTFVWKTAADKWHDWATDEDSGLGFDMGIGYIIAKASIDEHNEFRGSKETKIVRPKILLDISPGERAAVDDAGQAAMQFHRDGHVAKGGDANLPVEDPHAVLRARREAMTAHITARTLGGDDGAQRHLEDLRGHHRNQLAAWTDSGHVFVPTTLADLPRVQREGVTANVGRLPFEVLHKPRDGAVVVAQTPGAAVRLAGEMGRPDVGMHSSEDEHRAATPVMLRAKSPAATFHHNTAYSGDKFGAVDRIAPEGLEFWAPGEGWQPVSQHDPAVHTHHQDLVSTHFPDQRDTGRHVYPDSDLPAVEGAPHRRGYQVGYRPSSWAAYHAEPVTKGLFSTGKCTVDVPRLMEMLRARRQEPHPGQLGMFGAHNLVAKHITVAAHTTADGVHVAQHPAIVYVRPEEPAAAAVTARAAISMTKPQIEALLAPGASTAATAQILQAELQRRQAKREEASAPRLPAPAPAPSGAALSANDARRLRYAEIASLADAAKAGGDTATLDVLRAEVERRGRPLPQALVRDETAAPAPEPQVDAAPADAIAAAQSSDDLDALHDTLQTETRPEVVSAVEERIVDLSPNEPDPEPEEPDVVDAEPETPTEGLLGTLEDPGEAPPVGPDPGDLPASNPAAGVKQTRVRAARPVTAPATANDPDARNHDVGEVIVGARKHLAQLTVADYNKLAAEHGQAMARSALKRDKIIAPHDPDADQANGVTAGCSWLKKKIRSLIPPSPEPSDDAQAYIDAVDTVWTSLERCKTVGDVYAWHQSLRAMCDGLAYDAPRTLSELQGIGVRVVHDPELEKLERERKAAVMMRTLRMKSAEPADVTAADKEWREKRYALDAAIKAREVEFGASVGGLYRAEHAVNVMNLDGGRRIAATSIRDLGYHGIADAPDGRLVLYRSVGGTAARAAKDRVAALGKRFSDSITHMGGGWHASRPPPALHGEWRTAAVKTEAADDWSWAGGSKAEGGAAVETQRRAPRTKFQRQVRDKTVRTGGREIPDDVRGEHLMTTFGLRAVQHGNWVADEHAAVHLREACGALHDMSDLLGISPEKIAQGGLLGLAFGARGEGGAGAGAAHYETRNLAINITRDNGRGTLAHEFGHFLDHVMAGHIKPRTVQHADGSTHTVNDEPVSHALSAGDTPASPLPPRVDAALENLLAAIHGVPVLALRAGVTLQRQINTAVATISRAGKSKEWQDRLDVATAKRVIKRARASLEKLQDENEKARPPHVRFARDAISVSDYLAQPQEMFARCFETWAEDKLGAQGRQSTYLVDGTTKIYDLTGTRDHRGKKIDDSAKWNDDIHVYPRGQERQAIVVAMQGFVDAIRTHGVLVKALNMGAQMSATFDQTRFNELLRAKRASAASLESAGQFSLFGGRASPEHAGLVPKKVTVEAHTTAHGVHVPAHQATVYARASEPVAKPEAPVATAASAMSESEARATLERLGALANTRRDAASEHLRFQRSTALDWLDGDELVAHSAAIEAIPRETTAAIRARRDQARAEREAARQQRQAAAPPPAPPAQPPTTFKAPADAVATPVDARFREVPPRERFHVDPKSMASIDSWIDDHRVFSTEMGDGMVMFNPRLLTNRHDPRPVAKQWPVVYIEDGRKKSAAYAALGDFIAPLDGSWKLHLPRAERTPARLRDVLEWKKKTSVMADMAMWAAMDPTAP